MKFKNIVLVLVCAFALQSFSSAVNAAPCQGPDNQTSQGIPTNGVTILQTTDITNQNIDITQNLEVASLSGGGNKITAVPFTFSGNKKRSLRITVTYPNQTFPDGPGPSRRLAVAETSAGFAQCDGGLADINADIDFVSPLLPLTIPTDAVSVVIEAKFKANKTYQVELLYIFEKVEAGLVEPTRIVVETIDDGDSDDSPDGGGGNEEPEFTGDIPVLQASTFACPKTADEYLEEALSSEQASNNTLINDKIDIELAVNAATQNFNKRTNKRVNKTRKQIARNIEVISSSLRTSKAALECAKEKINADNSVATDLKVSAIKEIDEAIANDNAALDKISKLNLSPGLEAALPIDLGLIQEDVSNATLDKRAANRALGKIEEAKELAKKEAAEAAKIAGEAAAEALRDVANAIKEAIRGGASPAQVADAQDENNVVAAHDELRDKAAVIVEAGKSQVDEVINDPNISDNVKRQGEGVKADIERTRGKIEKTITAAELRALRIARERDAERKEYQKLAIGLERIYEKLIAGESLSQKGKRGRKISRYSSESATILNKINRYREKAGLAPLSRF